MLFNRIYLNIVIRISLIVANAILFAFGIMVIRDVIININLALLILLQSWLFIRKMNFINRDLSQLFTSITYNDTSLVLPEKYNWQSYRSLVKILNQMNRKIQAYKIQTTAQEAYFRTMVEHLKTGLISIDQEGGIAMYNSAFCEMFRLPGLITSQFVKNSMPELYDALLSIQPDKPMVLKIIVNHQMLQVLIHATRIQVVDKNLKFVSLQDIKAELEERELQTWQKMTRVLTHEIMNSISPISSTIKTINEFLTTGDGTTIKPREDIPQGMLEDTVKGLNIIDERSEGLLKFVKGFRSLTLLPAPEFNEFPVKEMLEKTILLLQHEINGKQIRIALSVLPSDLKIMADKTLFQQILLNLMNNSIQALEKTENPEIGFEAYVSEKRTVIEICDNGSGIHPDIIENIFIPFFTTRQGGSGIGLSLARQIMQIHRGTITLQSEPGVKTRVILTF